MTSFGSGIECLMWSDIGSQTEPIKQPNKCCGRAPTLRLRRVMVFNRIFNKFEYECSRCGLNGGTALNEVEAVAFWNGTHRNELPV